MGKAIPQLLAGPILRHTSEQEVCFWIVTSAPCALSFRLFDSDEKSYFSESQKPPVNQIQIGQSVYLQLVQLKLAIPIPQNQPIYYDLRFDFGDGCQKLTDLAEDIVYTQQTHPSFEFRPTITHLLHGSCRKPHHPSEDGLVKVDQVIESSLTNTTRKPDLLLLTGDQVYVDDVAGPMLVAIHQLINVLGLYSEEWEDESAACSEELFAHPCCYYQRENLLPKIIQDDKLYQAFVSAKQKPVFTSVHAHNHLITFAEMMAMYLLVWSPECWSLINLDEHKVKPEYEAKYQSEKQALLKFVSDLPSVRRALAHIPSYMIFDDHDITDDWNLTRGWEELAYGNPYSKRIIGNALMAYVLCQGWGNQPDKVAPIMSYWSAVNQHKSLSGQDAYIDDLLSFNQWHYKLDTYPAIVVLDTRTQRWRSESNPNKPSGLMDWESLSDLQQTLIGLDAVIMVSPAPVFGVKLIEAVQKVFTFFGKALMVDAENWMAHKGAANVLLNIFRHPKTPPKFFILSGDVHYSFVYDIALRFKRHSPTIVQVTCSGIKNEFPKTLLKWLDRLNFVLYHRYSPLNWFTKRRKMRIRVRKPSSHFSPTLANQAGIGLVEFEPNNNDINVKVLSDKFDNVTFDKDWESED